MDLQDFFGGGGREPPASPDDAFIIARHEIRGDGRYSAVLEDLGFMWRWEIHRDGEPCQEGCSLSERSSREAVGHVLAFYGVRDGAKDSSGA